MQHWSRSGLLSVNYIFMNYVIGVILLPLFQFHYCFFTISQCIFKFFQLFLSHCYVSQFHKRVFYFPLSYSRLRRKIMTSLFASNMSGNVRHLRAHTYVTNRESRKHCHQQFGAFCYTYICIRSSTGAFTVWLKDWYRTIQDKHLT
jgi:hypothetical protein